MSTTPTRIADSVGRGLLAGFVGTAAMTVSSTVEARLRDRAPSTAPARATAKALGIASFDDPIAEARFNDLSHWGYGTGWGVVRGLLDVAGLRGRRAAAAHGVAVWVALRSRCLRWRSRRPQSSGVRTRWRSTRSIMRCMRSPRASRTDCWLARRGRPWQPDGDVPPRRLRGSTGCPPPNMEGT